MVGVWTSALGSNPIVDDKMTRVIFHKREDDGSSHQSNVF